MNLWNDDDWPMNIRKKDEEQTQFHKAVSFAFFLMLDGNDRTLPLDTIQELCRPPETPNGRPERVMHDVFDEDYGQILDVIESLKISLSLGKGQGDAYGGATEQLIAEFAESLAPPEDDFDVPLFRLSERRSTKPS